MERKGLLALLTFLSLFVLASCGGSSSERSLTESVDQNWEEQQTELNAEELQEDRQSLPDEVRTENDLAQMIDHAELSLDSNDLTIQVYLRPDIPPDWLKHIGMAWYLMQEKKTLIKDEYGSEQRHTFFGLEPGQYWIKYYLRYSDGEQDVRKSFPTKTITIGNAGADNAQADNADTESMDVLS